MVAPVFGGGSVVADAIDEEDPEAGVREREERPVELRSALKNRRFNATKTAPSTMPVIGTRMHASMKTRVSSFSEIPPSDVEEHRPRRRQSQPPKAQCERPEPAQE